MRLRVAWRLLCFEKTRGILAALGIFVATVLIFLQLGIYSSVPKAATLVYDAMPFDIALISSAYLYQASSQTIPRRRLYQAQGLDEVEAVAPIYIELTDWLSPENRNVRAMVVVGFDPAKPVFSAPDILRQTDIIQRMDTILVDTGSRSVYGPFTPGRVVEIGGRRVEIGGSYHIGPGFLGLCVAVTSDSNFRRLFPARTLGEVNMGYVKLRPGSDLTRVTQALRAIMPADTQVVTREELYVIERDHWMVSTSTGLIFGFGAVVAVIVGTIIMYQMLATQIARNLSQFAALKAIGYNDRYLAEVVMAVALMMAGVAFVPALAAADGLYGFLRQATVLPTEMTVMRVIAVLALIIAISVGSALLSLRRLRSADLAALL